MDEATAVARFRAARVARLATVGAAGQPHLVPVTFAIAPDSPDTGHPVVVTAIDHKPKTTTNLRRLRNIAANDRVSILADAYDEDWERLWWVRLDGTARILTDGVDRGAAIDWLIAKYPQYQANSPQGPVIRIDVDAIRGWSSST
ncbi:TIGR03668 family PPOX class F420-dependent oxidoreductase [Nocardia transvalensis]|uniref:TIGR03668 family PPOX class F420-dependent oxidoreductase n=1 Tax=Nocardia transvalensis TaxID=37333 RepID=UPI001E50FC2B|nr:TIGR03668 family PPOX class F420-dependent oxidoreductase [Nocardia transvalensis]